MLRIHPSQLQPQHGSFAIQPLAATYEPVCQFPIWALHSAILATPTPVGHCRTLLALCVQKVRQAHPTVQYLEANKKRHKLCKLLKIKGLNLPPAKVANLIRLASSMLIVSAGGSQVFGWTASGE